MAWRYEFYFHMLKTIFTHSQPLDVKYCLNYVKIKFICYCCGVMLSSYIWTYVDRWQDMCRTENVPLTKYLGANKNLKDLNEENVAGSFFLLLCKSQRLV